MMEQSIHEVETCIIYNDHSTHTVHVHVHACMYTGLYDTMLIVE